MSKIPMSELLALITPILKSNLTTREVIRLTFERHNVAPDPSTIRKWRKKIGAFTPSPSYVRPGNRTKFERDPGELECLELNKRLNQLWKSNFVTRTRKPHIAS